MVGREWRLSEVANIEPEDQAAIRLEILQTGRRGWVISLQLLSDAPKEFKHASVVHLLEMAAALADKCWGLGGTNGSNLVVLGASRQPSELTFGDAGAA